MDTHELAWAAGFFDGEGCISWVKNGKSMAAAIFISQKDPAVLERFRSAMGFGTVYRRVQRLDERHRSLVMWTYQPTRFELIQQTICNLWPWLSPVKRAQATRVLAAHKAWRYNHPQGGRRLKDATR